MKSVVEQYTINFLKRNNIKGINSNIPISIKSSIISNIIAGLTIPVIYLEEKEDCFTVLSQKDEVATILEFVRGNVKLENNIVMEKLLNNKFVGKNFFDFSDEEKESFFEQSIAVTLFRDLNDIEREVISGINVSQKVLEPKSVISKPVSNKKDSNKVVKSNVSVESNIDNELEKYLKNNFFEKVNISGLSNDVIVQLLMITDEGVALELSSKNIIKFKNSLEKVPDISEVLNYLDSAYEEKNTYLKKAHIPMIFVCAQKAIDCKMKSKQFKQIIDNFFNEDNEDYKNASLAHTSAKANVNMRTKIMLEYFKKNS